MKSLERDVAGLLQAEEEGIPRRAAGVLAKLGSHAGDAVLEDWLEKPDDELRVMAALGALLGLESDCYAAVRPLLDHPLVSVRSRLATLLGSKHETYGELVAQDLGAKDLSARAVRTLLDAFARSKTKPLEEVVVAALDLLSHADWGVRADAARALQHALALGDLGDTRSLIQARLLNQAQGEKDPYVRFWLETR